VSFFLSFNLENIAKTKHKGVNLNKKRPKTVTPFEEIGNFDLLAGSEGLIGVPMNWEERGRRKKAVGIGSHRNERPLFAFQTNGQYLSNSFHIAGLKSDQ